MSLVEAIVLGIVQGLTEFLPISSTAHLRVIPSLLGWQDPGAVFSAVIQLGSLLALLLYFFKDLSMIIKGSVPALAKGDFAHQDVRLLGAIILGTLPICIAGLLFKSTLEQVNGPLRSLELIGLTSIVMGCLLFVAERAGKHQLAINDIGTKDGLIIGLGQMLALVPGCSRSGITLTAALLVNMKRDDAARFSFLLGIPAIFLSGMLELKEMVFSQTFPATAGYLAAALLTSTLASYLAIWWLIRYLKQHSTVLFVCYRLIFGLTILILALTKQIH